MRANGSALIGSFGRHDQMVDATMGNPTGYLRFNGNRSEADDYHDGAGRQVPSAWMKWNAEASAAWTPGANAVLELGVARGDGQARYAGRSMDGSQFLREGEALRYQHAALPGILETAEVSLYRNRADHVMDNYTLRNPNPDGMGTMPNPTAGHTRRESLQSGFARLQGGGKGALQWVVGLGHNQRMPEYWELFSPNRGPQGAANAFAGVRPETTTQWDAGVQYRQPR